MRLDLSARTAVLSILALVVERDFAYLVGCVAPWLNWIEQPPPKGQVTGSNPVGVTKAKIVEI